MKTQYFENLIVDGEDMIIYGDIKISGNLSIKSANLIVSGCILFADDNPCINITNGDISAEAIYDDPDITVINGDIYVSSGLYVINIKVNGGDVICSDLDACDIESNGNIIVHGNASTCEVSCLNYLVDGNNDSGTITAIQDIYILGESNSLDLKARDIFIPVYANLNTHGITAFGSLDIGPTDNCDFTNVGR